MFDDLRVEFRLRVTPPRQSATGAVRLNLQPAPFSAPAACNCSRDWPVVPFHVQEGSPNPKYSYLLSEKVSVRPKLLISSGLVERITLSRTAIGLPASSVPSSFTTAAAGAGGFQSIVFFSIVRPSMLPLSQVWM